jgi:class 3 adenylate cyclase
MKNVAQAVDTLSVAREASERQAWRESYDAYSTLDDADFAASDLENFGNAAWWTARRDEAIGLRQRAYAAYTSEDERLGAARVALTLAWDHLSTGALAVHRGWFAKAERAFEGLPESSEHGYLVVSRGFSSLFAEGNVAAALPDMERAYELSQRFGNRDVEAMALVGKGKALVMTGEVDQGLALLDEATAAATGGELQPFAAGFVYCCTIESCQELGDFRRAAEWTEAANRWCDRLDVKGMPGACRVHRASIMRLRGNWPEAEEQALSACEELQAFNGYVTALGYYEIGEIRRRRGDFAAAEEAYAKANEWGHEPQPGQALLRLAEGKTDRATAALARALDEVQAPLSRIPLLAAKVEVALAGGDVKAGRAAAGELEQIVDAFRLGQSRPPAFEATVNLAYGKIALADGDVAAALECLRRARDAWENVGAPYEIAQARMLLGIAFRRHGDEHAATAELEAGLAAFERLGARLDEERVKELLGRLQARRTFLFTDIVDSTRLLETLGDDKWKRLLARHNELVRERIAASGGEVIKQTGDGFFASFDNAKGAIEAAIAIQRALAEEIVAPDVRIGAHTGGAFHTDADFTDYGGQGVHTAARIGAAAGAAEILVSRETLEGIGASLRQSEPRVETLKGLTQPIELVAIDWR